jgi:circadian clock protein KaiB
METRTPFDPDAAIAAVEGGRYVLRLYVTGATPRSARAIANIRRICEEHLQGRYELEVIDLYQQPELAEGVQLIAAPTLIKQLPEPLRRFVGDMSETERILAGLDVLPAREKD